jgi:hypothetical protein
MEKINSSHKFCPKCKQLLPINNFAIYRRAKDSLQPICKACKSAWRRDYYDKHPEKVEKIKEQNALWQKNYRAKYKELLRELDCIKRGSEFV